MKEGPKKSLGQHFLRCRWVISTLIHAAELKPSDTVLEIGPGRGILTRPLAGRVKKVIAIEKDERMAEELKKSLAKDGFSNADIIPGDILKSLYHTKYGTDFKIVANIPYYLTSRLLRLIFEQKLLPKLVVLTIQKEVAQRICAKPPDMNPVRSKRASNGMNLLALSVQAYAKPEIIKIVPASCFSPKPKVDSAIIKLSDISRLFFKDNNLAEDKFFAIIKTAFAHKRKRLGNTLGLKKSNPLANSRPEELSLTEWADLCR